MEGILYVDTRSRVIESVAGRFKLGCWKLRAAMQADPCSALAMREGFNSNLKGSRVSKHPEICLAVPFLEVCLALRRVRSFVMFV